MSFIEIYNEHVYDLLDRATSNSSKRKQLQLKYEQRSGNRYVADAKLVKVKTVQEALSIMQLGQQNRQVFSTLMNQCSSRSHSVFTIHVVRCPIDADNYVIEVSHNHFQGKKEDVHFILGPSICTHLQVFSGGSSRIREI